MAMHAIEGIPNNCQILHVEKEVVGDDTIALQCVLNADLERTQLLEEEVHLLALQVGHNNSSLLVKNIGYSSSLCFVVFYYCGWILCQLPMYQAN